MSEAWPEGQQAQLLRDSIMTPGENGEPSISKLIADHIVSGKADVDFDAVLDHFPDMPANLREELRSIHKQSQTQRRHNDELIIPKVLEENK
jgi:hypothetical protein